MLRRLAAALLATFLVAPTLAARTRSVRSGNLKDLTTTEWLRRTAIPFATHEPESGFDDLAGLGMIVGDARIVSLGEATHGSNEFFEMKHRILEYLVEEKGFTIFAIEAALPNADAVNDYVLHGTGDPARAIAGMGFWTWNVQEVLDMVRWMRAYNLRRGNEPPVQFRGFDMQTSAYGIGRLDAYLRRVDAERAAAMMEQPRCWQRYDGRFAEYAALPNEDRLACRASVAAFHDTLAARRTEYSARSSAAEFEVMLRYARVIAQNEAAAGGLMSRDRLMAENVEWLANTAAPGEKLVLWAHNYHVAAMDHAAMGRWLRDAFPGREMVIFGFFFDRGAFNARRNNVLQVNHVEAINGGHEELLRTAGHARMFVDLRDIASDRARHDFGTVRSHWMVGSSFSSPNSPSARYPAPASAMYDVAIWLDVVTESQLLPFY